MTESQPTSHSDLMKLRAKGKQLHRRTQSHTAFSLNEVANKKNNSEEFYQEMLRNHNILNGDTTQKVLEAAHKEENEKLVIVDDIDEIPNTGIIIPHPNNLNNPLNIQRRSLLANGQFQTTPGSQFKKIDLLAQVKNIDDLIGLNTILEKRNSMESIDTENLKKSPNMTNSGCSSQNISKTVSRAHSKHPSLDFRIGHSNSSSIDFRPMHSKQSSGDMFSLHSKQSSADFKPTHSKQSSADFRPLSKDPLGHGLRNDKEIDVIKYNLLSPKAVKVSETPQYGANADYFDKRNRFIADLQKSSASKITRGSSGTDHTTAKLAATAKNNDTKQKLKQSSTLEPPAKEKINPPKTQTNSKHRRTYSGNMGKAVESPSPREDLTLSAIFLNSKNPMAGHDNMQAVKESHPPVINVAKKPVKVDDSVKKLSNKTEVLEEQIKNIFNIIESFASEKAQLEEKIQTQDQKIKELMDLTTRYQEEIKTLKGKNEHKPDQDSNKRPPSNKGDNGGLNILTSTDGSAFDSSLTESSGFLSHKDNQVKIKRGMSSLTPHGQTKINFNSKGDEKKSPGATLTKADTLTKKLSLGTKKPTLKKV